MIHMQCSKCGKMLKASDAAAKKKAKCPRCGAILTVPALSSSSRRTNTNGSPYNDVAPQPDLSTEIGCPHCARAIRADPKQAGQTVGCPYCGGSMVVPGASRPLAASPVAGPAITLRCPHCQSMQIFDGSLAGQIVTCPQCRLALQVPAPQGQVVGSLSASTRPRDQFEFGSDREEELTSRRRRRNRGNGTLALILGLLAFFVFPLLGPVAVMVANGALRDDPDDGCAKGGLVLGWICTVILILGICLVGFWIFGVMALLSQTH